VTQEAERDRVDASSQALLAREIGRRAAREWCLFLDRDGVINERIMGGYVQSWAEFRFLPGVLRAIATLSRWAPRIVVVTNQQGVGKGLMTDGDLEDIHTRMAAEIAAAGGRLDAILVCPHLASAACDCRKPAPGLALRYLGENAQLDAELSIMVGDTDSDIEMGRRLGQSTGGALTIRIGREPDPEADATYLSLASLACEVDAILEAHRGRSPRTI